MVPLYYCLNQWIWELMLIFCGFLDVSDQAAQRVLMTLSSNFF